MSEIDGDYSFPFHGIDSEEFVDTDMECSGDQSKFENLNFSTFSHIEHTRYGPENNSDIHFYNNIDCNCEYHTYDQFKKHIIILHIIIYWTTHYQLYISIAEVSTVNLHLLRIT